MELHVASQKLFGFHLHRHVHRHLKDHFIPHEGNRHQPHVLHHRVLFLYSIFLLLAKVSALGLPMLLPYSVADSSAVTSENIITLTNQSRHDYSLPDLFVSPKLAVAAENKARDMMDKGYFAHYSPDGVSPWYWIGQAGYDYVYAGENLAIRFAAAEGVNSAWLASAAHRANILSPDFQEIGVAVLTGNFGEEGMVTLVVQMFGTPGHASHNSSAPAQSSPAIQMPSLKSSEKTLGEKTFSNLPAPEILFPLQNSFVNKSHFKIIGRAAVSGTAKIFLDEQQLAEFAVKPGENFEYVLPEVLSLTDGAHNMYAIVNAAGLKGAKSETINFKIDTTPPQIYPDKFLLVSHLGTSDSFDVTAGVAEDSIRTLALIGPDSASLEKQESDLWTGMVKVYHLDSRQSLPVEVFAQDMAGNENRQRLGYLSTGSVAGVFSFVNGDEGIKKQALLFGGWIKINDYDAALRNLYLGFVVFLTCALLLNIAIKRHVQHLKTIAASAAVIMLAAFLFVV